MSALVVLDVSLSIVDFIVDLCALCIIVYTLSLMRSVRMNTYRNDQSLAVFEGEREWLREQIVEIVEFIDMTQTPDFKHQ